MRKPAEYKKAILAGILAGGPLLGVFCQDADPGITWEQWLAVAGAAAVAAAGVYKVTNADPAP